MEACFTAWNTWCADARVWRVLLACEFTQCAAQEEHADEWLQDVLDGFGEDDYVVFDCPGQVHLSGSSERLHFSERTTFPAD